ncbi:MAG: tail fiber protein [Chitinophagaceae bacterium]
MDFFIGEIKQFSGDYAPRGWAFCDGRLLPKAENDALFGLIGTRFGGDGHTTFALPDLCGRVPLGAIDKYPIGHKGGHEEVILTEQQLPVHTHIAHASGNSTPNNTGPENGFWGTSSSNFTWSLGPGNQVMHPDSVQPAGQGHPHENRIPFVTISYIIALEGVFPVEG